MARISNIRWNELSENKAVLIATLEHINDTQPNSTARGDCKRELKELLHDALYEASMAWSCAFAKELREAVYEHRFNNARQMLDVKDGKAKSRALFCIDMLEAMC